MASGPCLFSACLMYRVFDLFFAGFLHLGQC